MVDLTPTHPASDLLRITHREAPRGVCVVAVAGEIDLASAPALRGALVELHDGCRYDRFVLDFSEVRYCDSTGISVLIDFRRRVGARGLVTVAGASAFIDDTFRFARVDRILGMAETIGAALEPERIADPPADQRQPDRLPSSAHTVSVHRSLSDGHAPQVHRPERR